MHKFVGFQVLTASGNIQTHLDQIQHHQLIGWARGGGGGLRDTGWAGAAVGAPGTTFPEVILQIPAFEELENNEFWVGVEAYPEEANNVWVSEIGENPRFSLEVMNHLGIRFKGEGFNRHLEGGIIGSIKNTRSDFTESSMSDDTEKRGLIVVQFQSCTKLTHEIRTTLD